MLENPILSQVQPRRSVFSVKMQSKSRKGISRGCLQEGHGVSCPKPSLASAAAGQLHRGDNFAT